MRICLWKGIPKFFALDCIVNEQEKLLADLFEEKKGKQPQTPRDVGARTYKKKNFFLAVKSSLSIQKKNTEK